MSTDTIRPSVTVVICTDGRADALQNTLLSLKRLAGVTFEVCVVAGPTADGTAELLDGWATSVKIAFNSERNLSKSRNIGLALSSADIVAFIDDDAIPEPMWLSDIIAAFEDPAVGAAGGIVLDHTGANIQYLFSSADRFGNADWSRTRPCDQYNFPLSYNFPYTQGTNSAFRRDLLIDIGGFDEEYEFYLDETDVCCRLVDLGWSVRQLPRAAVHHKFLSSAIRSKERVTRVLYPVLKNKLYFSIINNFGHFGFDRILSDMRAFIQSHESGIRHHVQHGLLHHSDLERFWADVDAAWVVGLKRGLSGERRLMEKQTDEAHVSPLIFPVLKAEGEREVFVFVSQEHPDNRSGGIGRYIDQLARTVSALGATVHLITVGAGHDRVDFEAGVWVHRLDRPSPNAEALDHLGTPPHIWAWSAAVLREIRTIRSRDIVTAVYAPIWDCEGASVLESAEFPLVLGLQTTLFFWLRSHPELEGDEEFQREFARPMLALERRLLRSADAIHAISKSIAREISTAYSVDLMDRPFEVIPLALEDWSAGRADDGWTYDHTFKDRQTSPHRLSILFVGRLEQRKGIDLLLEAIPALAGQYSGVLFEIAGRDDIADSDGQLFRDKFKAAASKELLSAVRFHGEVSETQLRELYSGCDIVVAPSRFESFGLVLLEAMMYAKPTVASRAGGLHEVGQDGVTTLYFDVEDVSTMAAHLSRLISDKVLRSEMGAASRRRYVECFSPKRMATEVISLMRNAAAGFAEKRRSPEPILLRT